MFVTAGTFVAAYLGIPTILLSMLAVSLIVGHFWPRWLAREVAEYWTPLERYLQFTIFRDGLVTCSAGGGRQVSFREVRHIYRAESGWLLWLRDRPLLWIPRRAFGQDQGRLIEEVFDAIPAKPPWLTMGWLYVGVGGVALAGTWAWYVFAS